ncbi:MAG: YwaF family protein [Clostridia bacterium]|nr:YwaF family protein [Clostridia bacterium]
MLLPYSLILLAAAPLLALLLFFSVLRSRKVWNFHFTMVGRSTFTRQVLSVLLLGAFCCRLFRADAIYGQFGLDGGKGMPELEAAANAANAVLTSTDALAAALVRWLGLFAVSMAILAPFFRKRTLHDFVALFGTASFVLSALFLEQSFLSITGVGDPLGDWRNVSFMVEVVLLGAVSLSELLLILYRRRFHGGWRRVGDLLLFLVTYLIPFMPAWAPGLLLGMWGDEPTGFNLTHRLLLYFSIFLLFYFYIVLRNKSFDERHFAMVALSASAFFNYFSVDRTGLTGLPLHLCNTAIMMMLVTYVFRWKGMFFFTYLVNVLGALFAILMPSTDTILSEPGTVIFWYNHIYAVILPILGVALAIFPKPNFKMVLRAIGVFTIYFVSIAFIDGWFNNAPFNTDGKLVDYFFLYSGFYVDKFAFALPLFEIEWRILDSAGNTLLLLRPAYQMTIYAVFIASMFLLWGIYSVLFRVSDDHKELTRKRRLLRDDHLRLLAELGDKPLSAPLNPEGENMIKIEHFSKIYNGTTHKSADDINLEIHAGEVFGFIGHNGAGKSTTIKSLVGIQSITEGRIEVEGYDIARQPMEAKMHIGYVSDNHAVYEKLTGREYVNYVADLYRVPKADREERLKKYTRMFHLEDAIDREIKGYSYGMKQKIMVISALIHNPKVWVLDEPLTGLDPTSSYQIKQCMREHANEGNIVFFSSHIIEVVERICDRIAIISGGKIRQCSTMDEIRASGKSLEEIYLQYIEGPEGDMIKAERAEKEAQAAARAAERAAEEARAIEDAEAAVRDMLRTPKNAAKTPSEGKK